MRLKTYPNQRDTPDIAPIVRIEPDIFFEWYDWLALQDDTAEYLITYTELEAQMVLALIELLEVRELWEDDSIAHIQPLSEPYQTAKNAVEHLRYKFMTNISLEHLVKSNLLLAAAITGRPLDLSTLDVDAHLNASHDYSQYGLANRLNQPGYAEDGNTLADAIRNQELAITNNIAAAAAPNVTVTNDIPVPSVTVEAALAPDVTVNFDTAAIATAVTDAGNALADRLAPTGQTIYGLMELSRQQLVAISGKIAPDGVDIKTSLDNLQCICTYLAKLADINAMSAPAMYLPILTKSSATAPINALKCDLAKYHVANHSQVHAEIRHYGSWFILAVEGSLAVAGVFGTIATKLFPGVDEAMKRLLVWGLANVFDEVATPQNLYDFFDDYDQRVPELICALYSACDGSDAVENLLDAAETFSTDTTKRIARAYFSYLMIYDIENMFNYGDNGVTDAEAQAVVDTFVADRLNVGIDSALNPVSPAWADGFDSLDCSECTSCAIDLSCLPSPGQLLEGFATSLFDGSGNWNIGLYPVDTWVTVSSAWYSSGISSRHEIHIRLDDSYDFELELYTVPDVQDVRIQITDCNNDFIHNQIYGDALTTIGIFKGYGILCQTWPFQTASAGQFSIRIRRRS